MPDQMRLDGDIVIGEIAIERVEQPQPSVACGMIGQLKGLPLDMRHCQKRPAFQQHGLRADMPDIRQVFRRRRVRSRAAIAQHRSSPVTVAVPNRVW